MNNNNDIIISYANIPISLVRKSIPIACHVH